MPRALFTRAQLLVVGLWAAAAAAILDAYAHANRLSVVQDAINEQQRIEGVAVQVDGDLVDRADLYVTLTLVATTVTVAVAAVFWIRWQLAVARTLRDAVPDGADDWRRRPATGAAVWFVPLVGAVAPPLVVARLLRAAGRAARGGVAIVAGWWIAWVAAAALVPFGTRDPDALADQRLPDGLAMAGDALVVLAAVLAIGVVRRLTEGTAASVAPPSDVPPDPVSVDLPRGNAG